MTQPTWEEIFYMDPTPTALQAAEIRGATLRAAWNWASGQGVKWTRPAGKLRSKPTPWSKYHRAGYTAREAAKESGGSIRLAIEWANKTGVSWPARRRDDSETVKRDPKKPRKYAFTCSEAAIKRWEEQAGFAG